jgi:hypothetical protein
MLDHKISKTINQTLDNVLSQVMHLSLFLLPTIGNCKFLQYLRTRWVRWVSYKWGVGFLYFYKLPSIERRCLFTCRADFSFCVVRTTLICLVGDFLICILHLVFDQSAKGDKNILYSYTIFKHSLLTRRIFFIFWQVIGCDHQLNNIIWEMSSTE